MPPAAWTVLRSTDATRRSYHVQDLDTRYPAEPFRAHLPSLHNFPLFSNRTLQNHKPPNAAQHRGYYTQRMPILLLCHLLGRFLASRETRISQSSVSVPLESGLQIVVRQDGRITHEDLVDRMPLDSCRPDTKSISIRGRVAYLGQ